jgi:hypothetical protein
MLDNAPMQGGVCWREWVLGGFMKPPQHRWVDVLGVVVDERRTGMGEVVCNSMSL